MPWSPLPDPAGPPPHRVGEDLDLLVRQLGGRAGVATAKIFSGWAEAVGPSVAAHAEPLALHGATLVVGVDAPAYATQLRLLAPQLLARLGDLVGVGAVDAIEVRVRG